MTAHDKESFALGVALAAAFVWVCIGAGWIAGGL